MCKFTAKIYISSVSKAKQVNFKFSFLKFPWWCFKVIAVVAVFLARLFLASKINRIRSVALSNMLRIERY